VVDGDLLVVDGDLMVVDGDLIVVDGDLIVVDGDFIVAALSWNSLHYRADFSCPVHAGLMFCFSWTIGLYSQVMRC